MAYLEIPVTNQPNQTFTVTLSGDSLNINVTLDIKWNRIANYWTMDISAATATTLLTGIPLLVAEGPYGNLLNQYAYLGLGTIFVFPLSQSTASSPGVNDWQTNFKLVWTDE